MAALGESAAAAPVAGAAPDLSVPSTSAEIAPSTPSADAADAGNAGASVDAPQPSTSDAGSSLAPLSSPDPGTASDGGEPGNADASAAGDPSIEGAGSAPGASLDAGTLSTDESSLGSGSQVPSLPHRVAQHLESIFQLVVDHVRQAEAPADVAKAELKLEIEGLLHKLSNGIAVTEGQIVAKLSALLRLL